MTLPVEINPLLLAQQPSGYQISRSVRLRSSAGAYFNRTPAVSGSRTTWTWSGWIKRGNLSAIQTIFGAVDGAARDEMRFDAADTFTFFLNDGVQANFVTSQVFRDPSAWYHFIVAIDSTQATASNRVKIYLNGSQITSFSTASYPSLNYPTDFCGNVVHRIGRRPDGTATNYLGAYLTEFNFVDGQQLTPSSFGEFDAVTGVWKPKKYSGTYGTNGFYLNFSDNSAATAAAIGKDYSGNGNNWTPNNISVTAGTTYDSMLDVPTNWDDGGNGRGNYAVLSPVSSSSGMTITDGNLNVVSTANDINAFSSISATSGKWYCEVLMNTAPAATMIGVCAVSTAAFSPRFYVVAGSVGYYIDGQKYIAGTNSAYGSAYAGGDLIGIALDMDARTVTFYKNGVSQGVISGSLTSTGDYYFVCSDGSSSGSINQSWNFGQQPFVYTPPTGYKALNTQNLPDATIKKGAQYFDATLYTGTGATQTIVNGSGMPPNLLWIKNRSNTGSHHLFDTVRGVPLAIFSDSTNAEESRPNCLTSFNSNGFTVGSSSDGNTNLSSSAYVAWQWKEGATQGFDIVVYTGNGANRTIAHSLGVAPSLIIVKRRDSTGNWPVYHASNAAANTLYLNSAASRAAAATVWNSTAPTSTVFSVGTSADVNANSGTYVAYLFAEVSGFSKFGSYAGNGNANGPFVYCGFRPRFLLIKNASDGTARDWEILDTARDTFNVSNSGIASNTTAAENTGNSSSSPYIDILSNGFKLRGIGARDNSGQTYVFAAFAENPFKYSLAR